MAKCCPAPHWKLKLKQQQQQPEHLVNSHITPTILVQYQQISVQIIVTESGLHSTCYFVKSEERVPAEVRISHSCCCCCSYYYYDYNEYYYVPSSLTTTGTVILIDLAAFTMPLAIVAQFTIPPNTFTRIAFTCKYVQQQENNQQLTPKCSHFGTTSPL